MTVSLTCQELLKQGTQCLFEAGIAEADLDAWYLLSYVTDIRRADYFTRTNQVVSAADADRYQALIKQRAAHYPLQYITGQQEFMGHSFYVNEHVLIPRQDTETLVERALERVRPGDAVLDMCTGSGCILLSLMLERKLDRAVGADFSEDALAVAVRNARQLGVEAEWIHSDLFDNIDGTFDIILSNPPYIERAEIEQLMPEVRLHEPLMALDGHEDGLFFYRKISAAARQFLKPGGCLMFEIGWDQGAALHTLLNKDGYTQIQLFKDLAGLDRVVCGIKPFD